MHSFDFQRTRCDNTIFRVSANTLSSHFIAPSLFCIFLYETYRDSLASDVSYSISVLYFSNAKEGGAVNGTENRFNIIIIIRSSLQAHIWHKRIWAVTSTYFTKKRKLKNPFVCFNIIPLWCKYLWIFPFFSPHKGDLEPALFAYENSRF